MQWLFIGLVNIVAAIAKWFVGHGFKAAAVMLTYVSVTLGLLIAFLATIYAALNGLVWLAPNGVSFGLSLLPSSTGFYMSGFLTTLVAKRLFDWYTFFSRDVASAIAKS